MPIEDKERLKEYIYKKKNQKRHRKSGKLASQTCFYK